MFRCSDLTCLQTILASIVINHLQEKFQTQDSPVICMYLDYKESRAQTLENLLGSLLKQLIQLKASRSVSMELQELYRKARRIGNPEPGLKDICKILYTEIANYKRIYLVVDALDECTAAYQLLGELSKLPPEKLSLMITSRRIEGGMPFKEVFCDLCPKSDLKIYFQCDNCVEKVDLCEDCKGMNPCKDKSHKLVEPYDEVEIDVHIPDEDLKRYVEFEIGEEAGYGSQRWDERMHSSRPGATKFARKCQKDPELMNRIPAVIVEKADGRFLYAKLYVASLKTRQTIEQIKTTLETFPDNLNDLYAENLQRIQRQDRVDRELGFKVLSRTVCARRPLSLAELQQLLATNPGDRDFNKDRDYDKQDILSSTAGLITIDGEKNVVRLVHLTLHTYLSLDDVRQEWFPQAEMEMASACLTCLNFDAFSEHTQDTEDFEAKKREHPFVAYASQYWGTHVLDADPDPYIEAKTVQLVNDPHRIAAYTQIAWSTDRGSASSWDVRSKGIDGLHICAWFGLTSIIAILLQDGHDVDVQEETYGQTPLIYACRAGHVDVVVQLLDHGACVTKFSLRGRTAMFEAIDQNHEEIVNHLLVVKELDINAVQPKHSNRTALMLAADREHFGIVTSLLNHPRIDVNQEDLFGRTALFYAAVKGSYMIVQDLLQHPGIDVNRADKLVKRSPLIIAAARDYDKIVELLLEGGADPMLKDLQGGGTAMHRAIDNGCTSVIETMLKYDIVNFQCLDDDGRSLLHAASASGQLDIFHLLKKKNLDSNAQDKQGLTPLHGACRHGQLQITKALLELGADPAIRDNFGRIPLTVAWQYGQTQVMDVLKGNAPAARGNSTSIPDAKNLPLWSLARLGLADLIQQAVAAEKSESSPREPGSDNTALHCAIEAGKIDILRILLQKDHASIDYVNRYLRAPLHIAAVKGDIDALTELLKYHAEVDLIDIWGDTPLSLAQSNNHWPVAIALIEQGAEINRQKIDIKKMFFASIEQSNIKVVKLLLRLGADVLSRNMEGITAIQLAQEIGNDQMVRVLQSSPSFYYKAPGKDSEDTSSSTNSTSSMALKLDHDVVPFRSRPMPSICEPMAN